MGWSGSASRPRAVLADFRDCLAHLPMDEALRAKAAESGPLSMTLASVTTVA